MWKTFTIVLIAVACRIEGKKVVCQTVSLETDDGLSGYCCVIYRNQSEINLKDEEIKKQILDSLKNDTNNSNGDISQRVAEKNEGSVVTFPTESSAEGEIKFPGATNSDEDDKMTVTKSKNGTVHKGESNKNATSASNDNTTVTAVNRNAVDTPETCSDGNEKDHNGVCVPPF